MRCGQLALLTVGVTLAVPAFASASGVEPETYSNALSPGSSVTITKTVNTPAVPANPDIVFLSDTTGSMGEAIANVRSNVGTIMNTIASAQPTAEFAAADYKDGRHADEENEGCESDPYAFNLDQTLTSTVANVEAGVNTWSAEGGCDDPESQVNALYELATNPSVGFRTGSTRIVVWFGDAPGHDPDLGHTLKEAIAALVAANIHVIAVPVTDADTGLDSTGQATEVAKETGGEILPSATPEEVSSAILSGLKSLPVTIKPTPTCESGLTATYDATEKTVTGGSSATFQETLTVSPGASGVLKCTVDFLLNGVHVAGFQQTVTITVPTATGPEVDESVQGQGPNKKTVELSTHGSKDLIVAFVQADGPYNGGALQTLKVSGGGLTWKQAGFENKGLGDAEIWVAEASSALTKAQITVAANVTTPGSPKGKGYETAITVVAFKNASGYEVAKAGSKFSSEPRASLTTKNANSWVWASGNDWLNAIAHVPGSGQEIFASQLFDSVGDTYWVQREHGLTPSAGTKVTINDTSPTTDVWNLVLIEIH